MRRLVICGIVFCTVIITGCGTAKNIPTNESNKIEESVTNSPIEDKEGIVEDEVQEDTDNLLKSEYMEKLIKEAKESLVVASNKRDVDTDSENLYVVNTTILKVYDDVKMRKLYQKKYKTTNGKIIGDAITKDVSDYMNKELEK